MGVRHKPKKRAMGAVLRSQGFDESKYDRSSGYYSVKCSQCEALVVNGIACHEHGCPNKRRSKDNDDA